MTLKAFVLRLKLKQVPVEISGFIIAMMIGMVISYFLDGTLISMNILIFGLLGAVLARLHNTKKEQSLGADDLRPMLEGTTPLDPPKNLRSKAELRKLNLEIEDLKQRTRWERRVARYVAPVTVAVGLFSLLLGLYQFKTQQWTQHEQDLHERQQHRLAQEMELRKSYQSQVRADLDQLLKAGPNANQTLSTTLFLLSDLKTILNSKVNDQDQMKDIFADYERDVTMNLLTRVKYDSDFSKSERDIRFAKTVLDNWNDYRTYLKGDLDSLERVLYLHIRAIRRLHDDNPGYFEEMEYDEESGGYLVSARFEKQPNEQNRYQHFQAIKEGFTKHVQLLDGNPTDNAKQLKELVVRKFQAAVCNQEVSTSILKIYLDEDCDKYSQ